jgi:Fe-S-cluster-containing dehydrogenase component/DMSO reductase anchor subunit
MDEGFKYNHNKCVGCRACSAACFLENKWPFTPRVVYTFNSAARPAFPVVNISLACNHCKNAICMEGCPASAIFREPSTGAIIIDDEKCIGCRYCHWNCPYDAPKYQVTAGVIGKCNFCYTRLKQGMIPACTEACPTGALTYGTISTAHSEIPFPRFPDKNLEPDLELNGTNLPALRIFPSHLFDSEPLKKTVARTEKISEWSLIAFSYLTICSVAKSTSSLITGTFPDKIQFIAIIALAGLLSLFHLGKKGRVLRAVFNIRSSPLSREIVLFILYSVLGTLASIFAMPLILLLCTIAGLVLLLAIDNVYIFADKRKSVFLHSGQAFLTGLLIASFISGMKLPFAFVGIVKLVASLSSMLADRNDSTKYSFRFIRSALLVITGTSLIANISYPENEVVVLFFLGELLDRILFYIDFKPLNISRLINDFAIGREYEKERG